MAQTVPTMIGIRSFRYYSRRTAIDYGGAKKVMPLVWRRRMCGLWEYTFLVNVFGLFKFSFVVYDKKQFENYYKLMKFKNQ